MSGSAITDFVHEYSEVVATALDAPPVGPASELHNEVKAAVTEALLEIAPPSRRTTAGLRKKMSVSVTGKRTSLCLRQDLVARAQAAVGKEETRKLIHEFANNKPADRKNRTAWVEERLEQHLLIHKVEVRGTKH